MAIESWVPPHQEGEKAEAEKYTGTTSKISRGKQRQPFGIGTKGVVMQEKIVVSRNDQEQEVDLVTKYFKESSGLDSLESSVAAYKSLKEAGVKHIPVTYRKIATNQVLMTDYNRGNKVTVGGNEIEKAKGLHINSISNFLELLVSIEEDILHASNAGIDIYTDSYFFIVPTSGGKVRIDFVIGDFGGIRKEELTKPDEIFHLYLNNIERVKHALFYFNSSHVTKKQQKEYEQRIQKWAASLGVT